MGEGLSKGLLTNYWQAQVRWSEVGTAARAPPTAVLVHGVLGNRKNMQSYAHQLVQVNFRPVCMLYVQYLDICLSCCLFKFLLPPGFWSFAAAGMQPQPTCACHSMLMLLL